MSDRPWIELPDDEIAELIAYARQTATGPDGMPRVWLPDGAHVFVAFVVALAAAASALLKRAQRAERSLKRLRRPPRRGAARA